MKEMTPIRCSSKLSKDGEEGYILISVIFMLAVLAIWMAVAAPKIARQIQRDRELETIHRGKQYARAIKLFYKKFGVYPPSVDALMNTNGIRFLRRKYVDPTTGKEEWTLIRSGQFQLQNAGQAQGQIPGQSQGQSSGTSSFSQSVASSPNLVAAANSINATAAAGAFGNGAGSSTDGSITTSNSSSITSINAAAGIAAFGTGATGQSDQTIGSATTGQDGQTFTSGPPGQGAQTFGSGVTGQGGQTIVGGFMGVSPGSPKGSIVVYKKHNHYNEWQFVYSPGEELMPVGGNTGSIGQPASSTSTPIGGAPASMPANSTSLLPQQ
jgi:type II secretory pathway pseudopilin PulG